jgi:hypothetical protein
MRFLAVLVTALALVPAGGARSAGGLYGVVTRSPIRPACVAERPCSAPLRGGTLVFSRAGRVVARATTDANGRYRVVLAAGAYAVRVLVRGVGRRLEPPAATVRGPGFARVDFRIDTGIR